MAVLKEYFRPGNVPEEDESISSFLSRRLSPKVADLASAVMHGIYAGDIDQLSALAIIPWLTCRERYFGSIGHSMLSASGILSGRKMEWRKLSDITLMRTLGKEATELSQEERAEMRSKLKPIVASSVYTFRGGLETLAKTLIQKLELSGNVKLETNSPVTKLELTEQNGPFSRTNAVRK